VGEGSAGEGNGSKSETHFGDCFGFRKNEVGVLVKID
jgi:hypothetical protein